MKIGGRQAQVHTCTACVQHHMSSICGQMSNSIGLKMCTFTHWDYAIKIGVGECVMRNWGGGELEARKIIHSIYVFCSAESLDTAPTVGFSSENKCFFKNLKLIKKIKILGKSQNFIEKYKNNLKLFVFKSKKIKNFFLYLFSAPQRVWTRLPPWASLASGSSWVAMTSRCSTWAGERRSATSGRRTCTRCTAWCTCWTPRPETASTRCGTTTPSS
jgi:hypothetical protein